MVKSEKKESVAKVIEKVKKKSGIAKDGNLGSATKAIQGSATKAIHQPSAQQNIQINKSKSKDVEILKSCHPLFQSAMTEYKSSNVFKSFTAGYLDKEKENKLVEAFNNDEFMERNQDIMTAENRQKAWDLVSMLKGVADVTAKKEPPGITTMDLRKWCDDPVTKGASKGIEAKLKNTIEVLKYFHIIEQKRNAKLFPVSLICFKNFGVDDDVQLENHQNVRASTMHERMGVMFDFIWSLMRLVAESEKGTTEYQMIRAFRDEKTSVVPLEAETQTLAVLKLLESFQVIQKKHDKFIPFANTPHFALVSAEKDASLEEKGFVAKLSHLFK